MPDERHPLDELLVGADHAVEPPAVVLAPGVGGCERVAFVVGRRRAVQRRRAGRARERLHDRFERLAGERLGLPGRRAEARAPEQPPCLRERDRRRRRAGGGALEGGGGLTGIAGGAGAPGSPVTGFGGAWCLWRRRCLWRRFECFTGLWWWAFAFAFGFARAAGCFAVLLLLLLAPAVAVI